MTCACFGEKPFSLFSSLISTLCFKVYLFGIFLLFIIIFSFLNPHKQDVLPKKKFEEKVIQVLKNELNYPGKNYAVEKSSNR